MANDDYEILPHQELEYLRKEVERLKGNPFGDTETGQTLLDSMNSLTGSINKLLAVLETANDEIIRDYQENKTSKRMDEIIDHNEKLAAGIVAIGELVKKVLTKEEQTAAMADGFQTLQDFTQQVAPEKPAAPTAQEEGKEGNPFMPPSLKLPPITETDVPPPPQ